MSDDAIGSRRTRAGVGALSPWVRPPERPARYWLPARLSDMLHGWWDGKCELPKLEQDEAGDAAAPVGEDPGEPEGTVVGADPVLDFPQPRLKTPRMAVLSSQAMEQIASEELSFHDDSAELKKQYMDFLRSRDSLADKLIAAKGKLERAQQPLSEAELGSRRLAERNAEARPEELVRGRRQAGWERRLAAAEREYQAVTAGLAQATREAVLREELIRARAAVAQAAAHRHHELAMRRIATYLQQLVRSHPRGGDLNLRLIGQPVGPELPKWVSASDDSYLVTETGGP